MSHYHAVVWLDHSEAHVFHFSPDDVEKLTARSSTPHPHQHHKRGAVGSGHVQEDQGYYHQVAGLLKGAREILVVGPAGAKLGLIKHIHKHHHDLVDKVIGVESLDHPSDGQLLAHARRYFHARDRMIQ